uniref:PPM-type phosphatase domain-containing protein n=1 Tax=Chromera velia CCMP2878 TaxID=1169474 RepID=A0A0G4GC43_9ALVE|eukprot:Cvel_21260.t1-p1 / transcript=Cvel_21260.t1 / gene=Cvel_21260 / organism=Chromera_velia_CCMP2878 / gene_product=Probable protein phosphatase 2C T23F11.1, putative / transcript_product=Probable protein phosphatase 2C T23F11.1, putative / location=Cvel_scaffold1978:90-8748(+) / protein_length=1008 / sequence_SO=supercontig / SO=protein_coding / is_pseudo=false
MLQWGLTLSEKTLLRLALMEIFVYKEEGCRPLLLQSAANGRIIAKVPWAGATVHSGKPPVPSPETATQQLVAEETEEERTWNFRIERALALSHGTLTKEGHLLPPKSSAANAQEAAEAEERAGPDEATAMDVLDSAMETAATGGEGGGEGDATTVGSGSAPAGADTEMGTNSPVHPSVEPSNGTADGAPDGSSVVASPTSANTEDTPMQDAQTPGGASKSEDVGDSLASNLSGEGGNNGAGLDLSDSDRPESAGGDTLVDVIMETAERRDGGGLPASGSPISPSSGVEGGVDDGDGVGGRAVEGLLEESPVQADPPDLPASSDPPPVKAAAAPALSEESAAAGPPAGAPSVSVSATTAAGVKEDAEGIDEIMEDAESLKDSSGGATVDSASLQGYTASAAGESSDDHTIIVEKGGEEAEAWEAGLCGPFFVRRTPEPVGWGWWDLVDLGDPQGQNGDPTASSGVVRGTCRWRRKGGGLDMCLALSPHTLCCMGKTWLESQPKHWEIYFDPIHMEESGSSSTAAASSSCSSSQPPSPSSKAAAEPGKKAGGGKDKGGKGGKGGKEKDEDKGFSMKSSLRFSFGPPSESLWTDPEDLSRRLEFLLGGPDWKHQFPLDSLQRVPTPPELNLPSLPPSKEKEKENEGTPARPPHVPAVPIGLFAVRLANQTIIPPSECWLALQKDQDTCLRPGDVFRIGKLEFSVLRFNVGCAGEQGFRQQMEDEDVSLQDMGVAEKRLCSFFAVYDGHGGRTCAEFVRDNLHMKILKRLRGKGGIDSARRAFRFLHGSLLEAFRDTDEAFLRHKELSRPGSGCAAVVVILVGGWIWCANCGDSRAVLCRGGKAVQLSSDHKPDREDELHRISKAGGFVSFRRVLGRLAVSRAFGDFDYKVRTDTQESGRTDQAPLVTSVPEVRVERLQHNDDFLLLACDGLFDVFTSQEAVDFVREGLSKMRKNEQDPQKVVQELIREAIRTRRSRDNVTAILLTFKRSVEPPRTHAASAQQQGGQGQVRK